MIINKVTTLRSPGAAITDAQIQEHFDEQNADGWNLVSLDNLVGWYRFFWEKVA